MMRPDELELKHTALAKFREVRDTYLKMCKVSSLTLYYDGEQATNHKSVKDGGDVSAVDRLALMDHWKDKLDLELANLRTHNVDGTAEMPKVHK